jgi:leader peptidase (prepilin peptidase)/N-methyltransferase
VSEFLLYIYAFVLGALIGSFLNVVVYRLPIGKSIVTPPSSCPSCGKRLGAAELVPIFSWLFQGARCQGCKAPISSRYPGVELLTALLFLGAAFLRPQFPDLMILWVAIALLVAMSFIDIDTYTLPDQMTFGGFVLGLFGAAIWGFPQPFPQALDGGLMAAGLLALVNSYGVLVMLRGKSNKWSPPVGYPQLNLAAAVGAWFGPAAGIVAGILNWLLNARTGKTYALPDALTLGLALLGPMVALAAPGWLSLNGSLRGLLIGAGGMALVAGLYWVVWEWRNQRPPQDDPDEVVAMGFGDVKMSLFLGAFLGIGPFVVCLIVAAFAGAILGLLFRSRKLPFGPYLAIGGMVAFVWGQRLIEWYFSYLGQ